MTRDPQMATLPDAIDWLRARWDGQRTAPHRLNEDVPDGAYGDAGAHEERLDGLGGLAYSPPFRHHLETGAGAIGRHNVDVVCNHPLTRGKREDCPECEGQGMRVIEVREYLYPMTVALKRLRAAAISDPKSRKGRSLLIIYSLPWFGWSVRVVRQVLGCTDAEIIAAIRDLSSRYERAPEAERPRWTQLSESQQHAIEAGEVAA